MKAVILLEQNKQLVVDEIELPELSVGQVLVKIEVSGICGRQIGEITGAKGEDKFLPHLLGHEGGGIVEQVGAGVTTVNVGDKVVMHWRKGDGIESGFPSYKWGDKIVGGGLVTTLSEYSVVSENRVTTISSNVPFDIAALMGCATTTALGLINNEAKLKIGQSVAVIGAGNVGLNLIQASSLVSAYPIIAVDIVKEKLDFAKEFGATHFINTGEIDLDEGIKRIVGRSGVDVVIDCTGIVQLMSSGFSFTASGGTMVMVGQPHHEKSLIINSMANNFTGKTLIDSEGGKTDPTVDIPRYLKLYESGKLELDKLITNRYKLDNINRAIDEIRSGNVIGKCIIEMT